MNDDSVNCVSVAFLDRKISKKTSEIQEVITVFNDLFIRTENILYKSVTLGLSFFNKYSDSYKLFLRILVDVNKSGFPTVVRFYSTIRKKDNLFLELKQTTNNVKKDYTQVSALDVKNSFDELINEYKSTKGYFAFLAYAVFLYLHETPEVTFRDLRLDKDDNGIPLSISVCIVLGEYSVEVKYIPSELRKDDYYLSLTQ